MTPLQGDSIPSLLVSNLPRGLVMAVEDALAHGATRGFQTARGMEVGHFPHVVGQMRHFHMNEAFHRALAVNDFEPSPLRGNEVVTARAGIFKIGRFNVPYGLWTRARRSQVRKQMALANRALEPLVQPSLFETYERPATATAFFVAVFGSLCSSPEVPASICLAVPNGDMTGWLFIEELSAFLTRYDVIASTEQLDLAKPTLKKRADDAGESGSA